MAVAALKATLIVIILVSERWAREAKVECQGFLLKL